MKYLKYYITPVLSPIIIIGILLGGHWMWLGFGELLFVMIIGDYVLGEDANKRTLTFSDNFRRTVFTTTIRLNNVGANLWRI